MNFDYEFWVCRWAADVELYSPYGKLFLLLYEYVCLINNYPTLKYFVIAKVQNMRFKWPT